MRFAGLIEWPQHLALKFPDPQAQAQQALAEYFEWKKADWGVADFLAQCSEDEIPKWLRDASRTLKEVCEPPPTDDHCAHVAEEGGEEPETEVDATH
jgi:putative ATP-dependent endonuclease of OLD family